MGDCERLLMDSWSLKQTGGNVGLFLTAEPCDGASRPGASVLGTGYRTDIVPADADIPAEWLHALTAAVVEVDPAQPRSLQRLSNLVTAMRGRPVIAAIARPDVATIRALLRDGVVDVVSLPLDFTEVDEVIVDVIARTASEVTARLCPLVAVLNAGGGAGATTVATHLCAALARDDWDGKPPLLVDLDIQFGSTAEYLGLSSRESMLNLLQSTERVDDALISSVATQCEGFDVLAAPRDVTPLEAVDVDAVLQVVKQLRRQYGCVVVDLPANWSDWSLSLVSNADLIVIVTETTVHSIGQAKKVLELLHNIGVDRQRARIAVNKHEKKFFHSISLDDVADTLGCDVIAALPVDKSELAKAQQDGSLVLQTAKGSKLAKEFEALGKAVRAALEGGTG